MRTLLAGSLSLIAPLRCIGCDEGVDGPSAFCAACATLIQRVEGPEAVFEYGGPIAKAIQRFKYEGRSELGAVLGSMMAQDASRRVPRLDAIVPVPLHWRRRRARGYDQAALLACALAKSLGVPARIRGLRRLRNTPSQVDLPYAERQRNTAGAFAAWRLGGARHVLVVDDVRTTGATLRAASKALEVAGVSEVRTLVLAARVLAEAT
jgi:ComF family protein